MFDTVAEFFDKRFLSESKIAAALGRTAPAIHRWKQENRLPQGVAQELVDLLEEPDLLDDLRELESDRGPGRPRTDEINIEPTGDGRWLVSES